MKLVHFQDKLIAVMGVSGDEQKYGHRIFRDLLGAKYNVIGINPKGESILGQTIYKSLSELQEKPHIIITVVKPEITTQIVKEAHKLGVKNIWMQPGSESEEAVELTKSYGMEVVGGTACFMTMHGIWGTR